MATRCVRVSLALAFATITVMGAPVEHTDSMGDSDAERMDYLTQLNAELDALVETGESGQYPSVPKVAPKYPSNAEMQAAAVRHALTKTVPVDKDESHETKSESSSDSSADDIPEDKDDKTPIPSLTSIPGYRPTPEDKRDAKDPDPYKQRGTFTKEMANYDDHLKWAQKNKVEEGGVKRHWDEIIDFQDPKEKIDRAKKIANDIYQLVHRPVAKKVEETAEERAIRLIKERGQRSAAFLNRILRKNQSADRKDKKRVRSRRKRDRKERKDPKLAIKHRIHAALANEDRKLVKSLKKTPEQWAIDEAEKDGAIQGRPRSHQQMSMP